MKKIMLSGVKPTGRPHIGNYFGAMKQFVDLQDEYESYIFIADYHALTTLYDAEELAENTLNMVLDYLAIGLAPNKTTLFKQSDVPEVCELAWIFNCITTVPGIDGQKMSKSYGNIIPLFIGDEEIRRLVMSIVTDSGSGLPKNVYTVHELFRDKKSLDALYEEKRGKYQHLKEALIADLSAFMAPLREKREILARDKNAVREILKNGGARARARAARKMELVRRKIGVM